MGKYRTTIEAKLFQVASDVGKDVQRTAGRAIGAVMLELWRARLKKGLQTNGRPYPKLSASYTKYKEAFVAGRSKRTKGKGKGRRSSGRKFPRKGPFAADSVPDFGALTGRLKRSASVKAVQTYTGKEEGRSIVMATVSVDLDKYGEDIVDWNLSGPKRRRRDYSPSLSNRGTSLRKKEDKELLQTFRGALRKAMNRAGVITQRRP